MGNEYEISRVTGKCNITGREFNENENYYAALFESPEGFERRDYSLEAWSGPPDGCFCYWKGRVVPREKKAASIAVDSSALMVLFCRLEEDESEPRQKFRFVLALLLMRKRLVRFEQAVWRDGREYWRVRVVREQTFQEVLNPRLSEREVERLSAQLTAILSGDAAALSELEEPAQELPPQEAPELPGDDTGPSDQSAGPPADESNG